MSRQSAVESGSEGFLRVCRYANATATRLRYHQWSDHLGSCYPLVVAQHASTPLEWHYVGHGNIPQFGPAHPHTT